MYLDGRDLEIPKPVVIDHLNPRHIEEKASGLPTNTHGADLDFEHLLLLNNVIILFDYLPDIDNFENVCWKGN